MLLDSVMEPITVLVHHHIFCVRIILSQPAHDVETTLYGRWNDIKTLKRRRENDVLTSVFRLLWYFICSWGNNLSENAYILVCKQNVPLGKKHFGAIIIIITCHPRKYMSNIYDTLTCIWIIKLIVMLCAKGENTRLNPAGARPQNGVEWMLF